MNKEDLKKQLQSEGLTESHTDARIYQNVFDALKREPEFSLPNGFADSVMLKIKQRHEESSSRDMIFLVIGVSLMVVAAIVGAILSGFKPDWGIFKFLSGYSGLLIFALAFVALINWLDHRLVKKGFSL